MDKYRFMKLKS